MAVATGRPGISRMLNTAATVCGRESGIHESRELHQPNAVRVALHDGTGDLEC